MKKTLLTLLIFPLFLMGCTNEKTSTVIVDTPANAPEETNEELLDTSDWKVFENDEVSFAYPHEEFTVVSSKKQALPFTPISGCEVDFQGKEEVCKYDIVTLSNNDQMKKFYFAVVDYDPRNTNNIANASKIQIIGTDLSADTCLSMGNNIRLKTDTEKALFISFESIEDFSKNDDKTLIQRCADLNSDKTLRAILDSISVS